MRGTIMAALLALGLGGQALAQESIQFTNGQWFDGQGFKKGTVYATGGLLTFKKPAVFQTVDLQGGWVVAPFGGLSMEAPLPAAQYLSDGVQYVMALGAPRALDVPASIDLSRALSVATQGQFDQAWAQTVSAKPDIIQVEANSTQFAEVVRRANAEKLRVAARVDSLAGYRAAVALNVDIIAGLPDQAITRIDAEETSRRRILVVSNATASTREAQAASVRALKSARAEQGVGGGQMEALYLRSLGVLTNRELLKAWTEITPRAIFPTRRIGYLREGYEASFVVLRQNPLKDFDVAVRDIAVAYRQGRRLTL